MEKILYAVARRWIRGKHLKSLLKGEWTHMYDSDGKKLQGIRGRIGAVAPGMLGFEIGIDLIEMQPGTAFPLHVHDGDHILYIESGVGSVHVEKKDRKVKKGDSIFIAAEYPHAVQGPPKSAKEPLVIVAFGHPHTHVESKKRMRHPHRHGPGHDHSHDH